MNTIGDSFLQLPDLKTTPESALESTSPTPKFNSVTLVPVSSPTFSQTQAPTNNECQEIADILNNRWLMTGNYRFDRDEDKLNNWLLEHGLLISMCLLISYPNVDALCVNHLLDSNHISASCIGAGVEVMELIEKDFLSPFPVYPYPTGVVYDLDSWRIDVLCSYPMDGRSKSRDDQGCGPLSNDFNHGRNSNKRLTPRGLEKKKLQYKNIVHDWSIDKWWEPSKSWEDFICYSEDVAADFTTWFPIDNSSQAACRRIVQDPFKFLDDTKTFRMAANVQSLEWNYYGLFDHPICVDKSSSCVSVGCPGTWYQWSGACSWPPNEFQRMIDSQLYIATSARQSRMLQWNQVILSNTARNPVAIAAVISVLPDEEMKRTLEAQGLTPNITDYFRYASEQLARDHYKVPLVFVNATKEAALNGKLFVCESTNQS